jgi:hypothetical protein
VDGFVMAEPDVEKLAHSMFVVADRFHRAANYLSQAPDPHLQLVSIANIAFAMEMYFKCLIVLDTGKDPDWKHDYVELFSLLSPETQKRIKDCYNKHPGAIMVKHMAALMTATGTPPLEAQTFEAKLTRSKDAFRNLRYIYQYASPEWDANEMLECIVSLIRYLRPDWFPNEPEPTSRSR